TIVGVATNLDDYAPKSLLDSYALTTDLDTYAEKVLLDSYLSSAVLDGYVSQDALNDYALKTLLDSYLSSAVLDGYVSQDTLNDYALKVLLDSYATPDVVDGYALTSDLAVYAEKTLLDSYAPLGTGGLTYADIDGYATKVLLDSYATTDVVDGYALASDLATYAEKTLLDSYLTAADLGDGYISFEYDELDPGVTDGSETTLTLSFAPADPNALYVFRNGALMRRVSTLVDDYQEYTLSGTTVTFLATGEIGEWYSAQYIDAYDLISGGGGSDLVDGRLPLIETASDPTPVANQGYIYTKNDDAYGTTELFYQDDSGQVTQITQDGYLATYNSLRGVRLLVGQELTPQAGSVALFARDVSGTTELFVKDDQLQETQITSSGTVAGGSTANLDAYASKTLLDDYAPKTLLDSYGAGASFDAGLEGATIVWNGTAQTAGFIDEFTATEPDPVGGPWTEVNGGSGFITSTGSGVQINGDFSSPTTTYIEADVVPHGPTEVTCYMTVGSAPPTGFDRYAFVELRSSSG
ncbi:MAG: hypothetical protein ACWGQW_07650, partial [bacterium]